MKIVSAQAFIDWDTARRIRRPPWKLEEESSVGIKERANHAADCFLELQIRMAAALEKLRKGDAIRMNLTRIYHGWHRGTSESNDRRALELARQKFRVLTAGTISILPDIAYGNELACGGRRVPIMDTLRKRQSGDDQQKMVDTALTADILSYARTESRNFRRGEPSPALAVVVANDDDLLPGAFAAETWGLPVLVLRVDRANESKHLRLSEMVYDL